MPNWPQPEPVASPVEPMNLLDLVWLRQEAAVKLSLLQKTDWIVLGLFMSVSVFLIVASHVLALDLLRDILLVALVTAVLAALLILRRSDRRAERRRRLNDYRQLEAWVALQPFMLSQLPFSGLRGGAISPDLAQILCTELLTRNPSLVVECGAGISTIIIGNVLRRLGQGKLISLEHDPLWAQRVDEWIMAHHLQDQVVVLYAPLVEHDVEGVTVSWYATQQLQELISSGAFEYGLIELLFVDGPPGKTAHRARYPAVPILHPLLGKNCIIVVDDAYRKAENLIVQEWCDLLGVSSEWIATEKGAAIIRVP